MAIDSAFAARLIQQQYLQNKDKGEEVLSKLGALPNLPDFIRQGLAEQMRKENGNKRIRKKRAKKSLRFTWAMVRMIQPSCRRINYTEFAR